MKIAALVLAAGGSSRLGQPKQLLKYGGESLVRRAVRSAREAGCSPILVVVGRDQAPIAAELSNLPVRLVPNDNWERGIGTSIRAGIAALAEVDAVIILVCDQPQMDAALLRRLIDTHERMQQPVVASAYLGTRGVPALFAATRFASLLSLEDGEGAKAIIAAHPHETAVVDFPQGEVDIDTPDDLRNLPNES